MSAPLRFALQAGCPRSSARLGQLTTRHGTHPTPMFMPVGTLGAVKGLDPADLGAAGAAVMLANAYHLMLRPGAQVVADLGGLHRFCGYFGPILTDSGGYQVFSLAARRQIDDGGVRFASHLDGATIDLSCERLVATQELLRPDIAMVLDHCPPGGADHASCAAAVARTTAWAKRCLAARQRSDVAWFGIVQGGCWPDLRRQHAQALSTLPFDGVAIGGVSVGEPAAKIAEVVQLTAPLLPPAKPRYLMGVGTPHDLVRGVAAGVDMFDCVMPSRHARNGELFVPGGRLHIKNACHRRDARPLDPDCGCVACQQHSRAFLRHLFVAGEVGYHRLATLHNVTFYLRLMERIRAALAAGTFDPGALLGWLGPDRRAG